MSVSARSKPAFVLFLLALVAGALGGCGGSGKSGVSRGETVDFYSSLPLSGASSATAQAIVDGAKLALAEARGRAGRFTVRYISLDDSTAAAGSWDPGRTAANARVAARDPKAVYYIGEYDSDASAVSMPILNRSGVPQVSPASTYVGLTTSEPGSLPGEPNKYFPTGRRTFLRIVPLDTNQAAALTNLMVGYDNCGEIALAHDTGAYGRGMASLIQILAVGLGADIVSDTAINTTAASYSAYAQRIKAQGVDCFVFAGPTSRGAVRLVEDVAATIPAARLYGADAICESAFTNPAQGGIPATIAPRFKCTLPVLALADYPGGKRFLSAYQAAYRTSPAPYAIYGYAAMSLGLDTVASLGADGNDKAAILAALFANTHNSVLGTYEFDPDGDTTLNDYGVYRIVDGLPTFTYAIT